MYNTLTGGKTEMFSFWRILPFWKRKRGKKEGGGRAMILWKTRFVFDRVGAQQRQDVYCTCKGIYCYETGSMLESDFSLGYQGWRCSVVAVSFSLTNYKMKKGWRLKPKEAKTAAFPLSKLFLSFFLFSLAVILLSGFLSLTQSTVGLNNIQTD